MNRRQFVSVFGLGTASLLVSHYAGAEPMRRSLQKNSGLFMPDESFPHKRTWMAFVANPNIWSRKQVPEV